MSLYVFSLSLSHLKSLYIEYDNKNKLRTNNHPPMVSLLSITKYELNTSIIKQTYKQEVIPLICDKDIEQSLCFKQLKYSIQFQCYFEKKFKKRIFLENLSRVYSKF